ncbi:MAG: hypothetical protein GY856_09215 [bacterium]|nr:hypothetical protein [bacterium]
MYDDGGGEALYIAGWSFYAEDSTTAEFLAKWDGSEFSVISGLTRSNRISTLAVYDDGGGEVLYAGGIFEAADGMMVNNVVRWDGTAWSALGSPAGVDGAVEALAVYDDGGGEALYVAGEFTTTAGGLEVNNIARWDGTSWSALDGSSGTGTSDRINTLLAYDDGGGEALYAGTTFVTTGGFEAARIARWDGGDWSPLSGPYGDGILGWRVSALAAYDDGNGPALYVGGDFTIAGGLASSNIARWSCRPWQPASSNALYLNDDRFQVEVRWRDFAGNTGLGGPVELTDQTGYFWFFDQQNIELVVKVLDACTDPYNKFWVFAAGLTNTEVTLTVIDSATQTRQVYDNPLNQPFAPILDTGAFATCREPVPSPEQERTSLDALLTELNQGPRPGAVRAAELTLNQDRFRVRATWNDFTGNTGVAQGVKLTDQTGYFWFFDEDNVELVVKVLDACADPYNKFWVFAAGLTNVEVTITVTDTLTGEEKQYHNPLSREFQPILDTGAFATCDAVEGALK